MSFFVKFFGEVLFIFKSEVMGCFYSVNGVRNKRENEVMGGIFWREIYGMICVKKFVRFCVCSYE